MTMKITKGSIDTYAASLAAAVNAAESGSTLILLADNIPASSVVTGSKSLTLDFNGKSLKANSGVIEVGASDAAEGGTGNALTITGTSEDTYQGNSITVYGQNQFYTDNWSGTLNVFTANQNVTGSVNSGRFRIFKGNDVKLSTLIAADHAFYKLAGTGFAHSYSDKISDNINSTKVMACTHPSVEWIYCKYCHAGPYTAEVSGKYYKTLDDAIEAANGGTVKLLVNMNSSKGYTIQGDFTLDLNGKNIGATLVIDSGKPKLINSAGVNGEISNLKIYCDATLATLLPEGWAFKVDGNWATAEQLAGKTAARIKVVQAPITSLAIEGKKEVEYGQSNITLTAKYTPQSNNGITFAWYKVAGETTEAITDAVGSTYTLPANLDAGTCTYRLTLTTDSYSKRCDFILTVKPANLANAVVTIIEEPTYNGTPQQPKIEVKMGETKLLEGTDYKIISKPITDCTLESEATLLLAGTGNYTGSTTATWQLKPETLTYTVTASPKTYNGTNNADVQVTFNYEENWIHLNDEDYTITANYDSDAPGENKTITGTVELKYPQIAIETTRNYILTDKSFSTTGSISKNTVTSPQAVSLTITNGVAKTYEVKLPALPALGEGCEYGNTKYSAVVNFGNNTGYYESGMAVENGMLTLPIKANATDFTGEIGTVTVTVESVNYENITLTVNVSATNRITPQLDGELTLSTKEITYGDKLSTIEISGKMKDGETPVDGTFAWQNPNNAPDANNAYTANWIFTPKDSEKYKEVTGAATIVVKQAKPTGEPKYEKISVGGKTLADAKLTTEGSNFSVPGILKWTLADTEEVKQGVAYEWTFTPDDKNYETLTGTIVLWANASGGGAGGFVPVIPVVENPTIAPADGGKTTLSPDGTTLTITPDEGKEVEKVLLNGKDLGAVTEIKGLKTGDKVEITFKDKTSDPSGTLTPAQSKLAKGVRNTTIVLKSKLTKSGKIRLTWTKSKDYKLDYLEVYRSTKKNSGYGKKPFFTTKHGSTVKYLNTKSLKKGKTYYYKIRGVRIIDGKKYYTKWSNKTWKTVK